MSRVNVKPLYDYILFKEAENPFLRKRTKSGLFLPEGFAQTEETGDVEKLDRIIGFGIVDGVGEECKYVKPGDGIFYDRRSIRPIPMTEPIWQFSERNVVAYIAGDDPTYLEAIAETQEEQEAIALVYQKKQEEEIQAQLERTRKYQERIEAGQQDKHLAPMIKYKHK